MVYENCMECSIRSHLSFPVSTPVPAPHTTCLSCLWHAGADCPCSAQPTPAPRARTSPTWHRITGTEGKCSPWFCWALTWTFTRPSARAPELAETRQPAQDGAAPGGGSSAPWSEEQPRQSNSEQAPGRSVTILHQEAVVSTRLEVFSISPS